MDRRFVGRRFVVVAIQISCEILESLYKNVTRSLTI